MPSAIVTHHITRMLSNGPDARRVVFAGAVAYGFLDISDTTTDDGTGALVRRREIVLTLPTGALALADASSVKVHSTKALGSASTTYTVRDIVYVEDGLVTKYLLVPSA